MSTHTYNPKDNKPAVTIQIIADRYLHSEFIGEVEVVITTDNPIYRDGAHRILMAIYPGSNFTNIATEIQ